jgi:hypothetical protein
MQQLEHAHGDQDSSIGADREPEQQELEAQLAEMKRLVEQLAGDVVERLRAICDVAPSASIRSELADFCWSISSWAESHNDARRAARYLELLAIYDDGRYVDLIEGTATLELDSDPDGAEVTLYPVDESTDTAQLGAPQQLGTTPLPPTDLAPGAYLVQIDLPGYAPTRRPLQLRRGSDVQLQVTLFRDREIGADFAYVPAGTFTSETPHREIFVDNYAIACSPVTVGEYTRFLDAIADEDPGRALTFAPRAAGSLDPRTTITGVAPEAADAYCRWLSRQRGVAYRLPSEIERRKAASAIEGSTEIEDGNKVNSSSLRPQVEASQDLSVYGARNLSRAAEWTIEGLAHAAELPLGAPTVPLGFRVVRELARGGVEQVCDAVVPDAIELEPQLDDDDDDPVNIDANAQPPIRPISTEPIPTEPPRPLLAAIVPIGRAANGVRARAGPSVAGPDSARVRRGA